MRWASFALLAVTACQSDRVDSAPSAVAARPAEGGFRLSSPAFVNGGVIPVEFTADGADVSPPLSWSGAPKGTAVFALVVDDPDAPVGVWDHWVLFDLPVAVTSLARGATRPAGAVDGTNSWGRLGYGGPAPPPGKPHRYFFKLFALSGAVGLEQGADKAALEAAMRGKILGEATWMGTYKR